MIFWIIFSFTAIFLFLTFIGFFLPSVLYFFLFSLNCLFIGIGFLIFPFFIPFVLENLEWLITKMDNNLFKTFFSISIQNKLFLKLFFLTILILIVSSFSILIYFLILKRYFITTISYRMSINVMLKFFFIIPTTFLFVNYVYTPFNVLPTNSIMQTIQVTNLGKKDNIYIRNENTDVLKNHFDIKDLVSFEKNWDNKNKVEQIEYLKKIDNLVKTFFPSSFYNQLQQTSFDVETLSTTESKTFKEIIEIRNFNKLTPEIKNKILSLFQKFIKENWWLFIFVPDMELF